MNDSVKRAAELVRSYDGKQLRVMEVCGTHTHENFRLGIRGMLPERIRLISGPGCPVCVTPVGYIDQAIAAGVDLYLSGEASEQTFHSARENDVSFIAAGHHATERYGVQALGDYLARRFALEHLFIDCPNPI